MNKDQRPISTDDFTDAVKEILLAPKGEARSENRMPTREELSRRYRLERKSSDPVNGPKT